MRKLGRRGSTFGTVVAAAVVIAVASTGGAVASGLITSAKIKNNTIKSIDVRDGNLTGTDLADGSVKGADVGDGSLSGADIADGSIGGADIADGSLSNQDVGVLFATVNSDGTLANSSGGVSSSTTGTGGYAVDFGRDVSNCAFDATLANPGTGIPLAGSIVTADRNGNANAVLVRTYDTTPAAADRSFHLIVVC